MTMTHRKPLYLLCVKNAGYEASLERRKVFRSLPNSKAEGHGLVRVIDESGEDYLYPGDFFVAIDLPKEAVEGYGSHTSRAKTAKQTLLPPAAASKARGGRKVSREEMHERR